MKKELERLSQENPELETKIANQKSEINNYLQTIDCSGRVLTGEEEEIINGIREESGLHTM